jgi:AcrR family transcriptional regulator
MEKRKTGIREMKSAETKEKIIQKRRALFRKNGLDNVSLNAVISQPAFQGVFICALRFQGFS